MKFLLPIGGHVDNAFGVITHPGHWGIPAGIKAGLPWGADNEAYTKRFDEERFVGWLRTMEPYRSTCLFVAVPDVVGNAVETINNFTRYAPTYSGWSLAFVAQDGQENIEFPDGFNTLFIGGTTKWKLSDRAVHCIQRAQSLGKRIHIGRVNYKRRYQHFAGLPGSEDWTCDGTRTRYEKDRALLMWKKYMEQPNQLRLPVPERHCSC